MRLKMRYVVEKGVMRRKKSRDALIKRSLRRVMRG